jgi:hypothetical protein
MCYLAWWFAIHLTLCVVAYMLALAGVRMLQRLCMFVCRGIIINDPSQVLHLLPK